MTALALLAFSGPAVGQQRPAKNDPAIGDRVLEAVPAEGLLWLLGANGHLARLDLDHGRLTPDAAGDAFGLAGDGQTLVVARRRGSQVVLSVITHGGEKTLPPLRVNARQGVAALAAGPDGPVVLMTDATFVWEPPGRWRRIGYGAVYPMAPPHVSAAVIASTRQLMVGYSAGEWGGQLDQVDLDTGKVVRVRGELPVTAVAADPNHPGCAVAAEGLSHMGMLEGGLLRVCNGKTWQVYVGDVAQPSAIRTGEPFFGLTVAAGCVWAVSYRHLVRLDANDNASVTDLPALSPVGGIWLSRDRPGLVVIRTDVNWANSVSGYTPLVVAAP